MRVKLFSILYRSSRYLITNIIYFYQKLFFQPNDLEPAVIFGDRVLGSLTIIKKIIHEFPMPVGYNRTVYELNFQSPLIGASFKSDKKTLNSWMRMGLGGLIFKTIMRDKRDGNPRPRLKDVFIDSDNGLLNALGLPGPGIEKFIEYIPSSSLWNYGRPLGISLGGDEINDYLFLVNEIDSSLKRLHSNYFYELNISCPNTHTGMTIGDDPKLLNELISKMRTQISKVISVKVSPDSSNKILNEIGEICASHSSIIINSGNTQYKVREDLGFSENNFSMKGGGLSGPHLFTRTLEMVRLFSHFEIPIMATGGISTINHVNALENAGASLFGMATSLVLDPYCIPRINKMVK